MSSSDNDPKKAEEMSLSELLGGSDSPNATPDASASAGEPVDDGSGLINLAQMVQASQPAEQPRPSSPSQMGMPGEGAAPAAQASGGYPAAPSGPSYDEGTLDSFSTPKKKNMMPIIIVAAILVVGGAVGAFVALSGGNSEEDAATKLAKLEADLAAAVSKAEAEGDATKKAELEAQLAAQRAEAEGAPGAEGGAADEDEFEFSEEEVDDGKGGKKRRRVRRAKRSSKSTSSSSSSAASSAPAATKEAAPAATAEANKPAGKTSELDSLLASKGSGSSGGGGLPEKPTRAQVQKAMGKVVAKAKNVCGKSGSGKVSVRIIVGSNGVVRDAIPTGVHSADSLGRCVATIARRTARLPKFKSPTFTFSYPFNI